MDSPSNPPIDPKFMRPYLRLGKYLSDDFLAMAERWLFLVSEHGISQTPKKPANQEEFQAFRAHCHDGWKIAQKEISEHLIGLLRKKTQLTERDKNLRREKNKEERITLGRELQTLELETRVTRRILDVILWTICGGDQSTLRRLRIKDGHHSFSIANIEDAMNAADIINKDPLSMALCTDMLSLVHVGDLLVVEDNVCRFVELKSGAKNIEIAEMVEFSLRSQCEHFDAAATGRMTDKELSQYKRVKRQAVRNETIISTIKNEGGTDPNTGATVKINPLGEPVDTWSNRIQACYEQLSEIKSWSIDTIDDCVYLGVYNKQEVAAVGFSAWMAQMKCQSKIFNLTDSFSLPSTRPVGAMHLSLDLRNKILRGDVLVIVCLDIAQLIELGNSMSPGFMRFSTTEEANKIRPHERDYEYLKLDGRYVYSGGEMVLGEGFRERIIFDQQRPAQLIANHIKMQMQATTIKL